MSLSRDVLKWLQSLDLTFPVKNAKRDFSNGYTIAEIFACYFPQDIQMHSFDNATSVAKKNDNWEQLEKFFKKKSIVVDHQLIVDTIHCKGNAAVDLIGEIYTLLTNKKPVKRPVVVEEAAPLPTFARPTASQLIKDNISTAEISGRDATRVVANKAQSILEKQKEAHKQERLHEFANRKKEPSNSSLSYSPAPPLPPPSSSSSSSLFIQPPSSSFPFPSSTLSPSSPSPHFDPLLHSFHSSSSPRLAPLHPLHPHPYTPTSLSLQNQRGDLSNRATTPIEKQKAHRAALAKKGPLPVTNSPDMDMLDIEFKQVQRLRTKSASGASSPTKVASPFSYQNGNKSPDLDGKPATILPVISEVVENKLANSDLLYSFDPKAELAISFFDNLARLPADVICAVFLDLESQTTKFCRSFFDNPKEMLYFFGLVAPIVTFGHKHCKEAVIRTIHAIGDKMTSYDASTTWLLFERNVFPFLVQFVNQNAHLHHMLSSVIFSFSPDDANSHSTVINKLSELCGDNHACLLNLVQSENNGNTMAIYKSEAIKLITNTDASQVHRATAVAVLSEIIPFDYKLILPEIGPISEFGETAIWWEAKVQVVLLSCEVLKYSLPTDDVIHSAICDVIGRVLASGENIITRILGSMALVPYLHSHQTLYPLYVELLLSLSPSLLRVLVLDEKAIPNLVKGYGNAIENYSTHFIPAQWNASEFLSFLVQELKATETSRLEEQHMLLCLAAIKSIPRDIESVEPLELSTWTQIFADLMDYICLAFCNIHTCELAEELLRNFMLAMKQHALQVFPTLHSTILMLFPNISTSFGTPMASKCQDTMIHFLLLLYRASSSPSSSSLSPSASSSLPPSLSSGAIGGSFSPSHPYFVTALENLVRNFPEHLVQTRLDVVIDKIIGSHN